MKVFLAGFLICLLLAVVLNVWQFTKYCRRIKELKKELQNEREKVINIAREKQVESKVNENLHTGNSNDDFLNSLALLQNLRPTNNSDGKANGATNNRQRGKGKGTTN